MRQVVCGPSAAYQMLPRCPAKSCKPNPANQMLLTCPSYYAPFCVVMPQAYDLASERATQNPPYLLHRGRLGSGGVRVGRGGVGAGGLGCVGLARGGVE